MTKKCMKKRCMRDEEMMEMPHGEDVKVKVMKLDGGNVHEMMNKLLGG